MQGDEPEEVTRRRKRYGNRAFQFDEGISYWDSLGEVAAVAPFGCLPLAMLSRAMTPVADLIRQAPGLPANLAEENERAWREMQVDLEVRALS